MLFSDGGIAGAGASSYMKCASSYIPVGSLNSFNPVV